MSNSLLLLLALSGPSHAGSVVLDGATWRALQDPVPEPTTEAPSVAVADRDVVITTVEGGLLVTARWTLRASEPGWFSGILVGPGAHVGTVTWGGAPGSTLRTEEGTQIAGFVADRVVVTLDAFVPGEAVRLLPAVRGLVHLDGSALSADGAPALSDGDAFLTGAADLALAAAPVSADAGPLILAHTGIGVTVGDSDTAVRAKVGWEVRRGRLDAVAIRVSGVADGLEVTGPNVASWHRSGDRIEITLREPAVDRVDVTLSGRAITPAGTEASLALPRIEPEGAFRTESTVQIAREEGLEVVAELAGWQPVPSSALPDWGRDLVIAAPMGAYRAGGTPSGTLQLLRFEPLPLPPLVIDVADHRVATTSEGRVLARALYEIRNERAPWLRIVPPEGWNIVGVRVSGDTARPVTDGGPGWLVPLPRSVDTVEGLLSFPVEVAFLGEGSPWADNAHTTLALPQVDAEVADWRATLFLPPEYKSRMRPGEAHVVQDFESGEGIVYGVSIGGAKVAEADALFEDAVSAWLDNDFEVAQERLDTLRAIGGEGENVDKLQSNLDLIGGEAEESEDYGARQIRSQARARAIDDERDMKELEKKAEERQLAGDWEAASGYYEQALEIGETIQQIEGEQSIDVSSSNATYRDNLAIITKDQAQREEVLGEAATALPWDVDGDVTWDTTGEVGWEVDGRPTWAPEPPEEPAPIVASSPEGGAYGAYGSGAGYGEDVEAVSQGVTLSVEELRRMPGRARSFQSVGGNARGEGRGGRSAQGETVVATGSGDSEAYYRRSGGGPVFGRAKRDAPAMDYGDETRFDFDGIEVMGNLEQPAAPVVHASALSVTIPEVGETVRFQRRLVPPGDAPDLDISARITARERRNS